MSPETVPEAGQPDSSLEIGAERADSLINQYIERSGTVGEVRSSVQNVLTDVDGDRDAMQRVEEYQTSLQRITAGHEAVAIEQMHGGLQGFNRVGTHDSTVNTDLFTAETIIKHVEVADEVLDHEDDEGTGHAGQIAGREGLVLENGDIVEGTELYEGEVESRQGEDKRGSALSARNGQPAKNYGSGQQKVAPKLSVFTGYLREGTDRVAAQAELLRGQNREKILVTLSKSGMYSKEEMLKIATAA